MKTLEEGKEGNRGVEQSSTNKKYARLLGQANAELFAQFLTRIYFEINGCILAEFSTLKSISGQHFVNFRDFFEAKLLKCFVVPANTFDNVKGRFPIGFKIWNTNKKVKFDHILSNVFDENENYVGKKNYYAYDNSQYINDWIKPYRGNQSDSNLIGKFPFKGNDFQNQNIISLVHVDMVYNKAAGQFLINANNVKVASIYYAVRKCIKATWLNDRDQFLYPKDGWKKDEEFQNDCLAYTLFNNNIQSKFGTNHWIPFTEQEVDAKNKFESNFMTQYIQGKLEPIKDTKLFVTYKNRNISLIFSTESKMVFNAGLELWKYYHSQPKCNVNASFYDIKEHFQGRNDKGRMNPTSKNETYMTLIKNLRKTLTHLQDKIAPKVYEYGFLKG